MRRLGYLFARVWAGEERLQLIERESLSLRIARRERFD